VTRATSFLAVMERNLYSFAALSRLQFLLGLVVAGVLLAGLVFAAASLAFGW
jgi:hypothetical protein